MDGKNIPFAPLRDIKKAIKDGFIFYGPSLAWMILISVNLTYHAEIIYIKSFADNAEERSVKHGPVDF